MMTRNLAEVDTLLSEVAKPSRISTKTPFILQRTIEKITQNLTKLRFSLLKLSQIFYVRFFKICSTIYIKMVTR